MPQIKLITPQFFSDVYYWKWDYPSILKADLQAMSLLKYPEFVRMTRVVEFLSIDLQVTSIELVWKLVWKLNTNYRKHFPKPLRITKHHPAPLKIFIHHPTLVAQTSAHYWSCLLMIVPFWRRRELFFPPQKMNYQT